MNLKYNHKEVEKNKNQEWIDAKIFQNEKFDNKSNKNFSIILPPPNVTGKLHLGHAWDGALQDILIRYKKMNGYNTVWIPGMDHAGIATQAKVENRLAESGIYRKDIGREEFLQKTWEWKEEYAQFIRQQWGELGLGLDYSHEKFTLDEDINLKVRDVFVTLYNEGLIYQGTKIINWDPKAQTAISDIEVEYKEIAGNFYYLKYYFENSKEYLLVATTRPETIFGDQALAINPNDERSAELVGKKVKVPGTDKIIPIITDEYVEEGFGTGVVKITPAHDPNDYEVGKRHNLYEEIVMNLDGTMNEKAGKYKNQERFECRKNLINDLKEADLVEKIEEHIHNVGHSERTGVVVEPLLSKQWFLKAKTLADEALEFQKKGEKVEFFPARFEKTYLTWMEEIHDWCISRQLWWGHQIPAWYHKETGELHVSVDGPKDKENYIQDEDVLDTWFSSALWPAIAQDEEMKKLFYPTSVLVTGYDIIFFWVSRMIFQGIKFEKKIPFETVLIHGLVRDEQGRKMSKSLGNGIDPMDVVDKYGADSLRYFLTTNSSPGQDLRYSEEKIDSSWNYINKIWNIARYVFMSAEDIYPKFTKDYDYNSEIMTFTNLNSADKYILNKLNETIEYANIMMDKYEFPEISSKIYNFVWDDFASWYLELSKVVLNDGNETEKYQTKVILCKVLLDILKMLHPFIPFVTEEIYSEISKDNYLVETEYPQKLAKDLQNNFTDIEEIIVAIRNFKAENDLKPSQEINIELERITKDYFTDIEIKMLKKFGKIKELDFNTNNSGDKFTKVLANITLNIELEGLIDLTAKKEKLDLQKAKLENELNRSVKMLSNQKFIENANPEKIQVEKDKALKYVEQYEELKKIYLNDKIEINNLLDIEEIKNKLI